jgi:hypothetical protein
VVALDNDGAGYLAVCAALELGTDIDQDCAVQEGQARPGWLEPIQACSRRSEQAVDAKMGSALPSGLPASVLIHAYRPPAE